ncbi:hypothetical protein [Paenibacillus sp. FSL R5-0701]|uniref:hypothetical protein n=1 Tax=Paenibacillus sp. FSL R5-0701 TaxID=2921654 RepID=UPI0030D3B326
MIRQLEEVEKQMELVEKKHKISLPNGDYHDEVHDDGVSIIGSVSSQMFLNNQVIDQLMHILKVNRSPELSKKEVQ